MLRIACVLLYLACSGQGRRFTRKSPLTQSKKLQKLSRGTARSRDALNSFAKILLAIKPGAAFELPTRRASWTSSPVGNPATTGSRTISRHRLGFPAATTTVNNAPQASCPPPRLHGDSARQHGVMSATAEVVEDINGAASVDSAEDMWETLVQICEERMKAPLAPAPARFADVPRLLHQVLDADFQQLLRSEKVVRNMTCMRPRDKGTGFDVYGPEAVSVPLCPGRVCDGGVCSNACSRVTFPSFMSRADVDAFRSVLDNQIVPENSRPQQIAIREDVRMTLNYVRLTERMRRAIAHEYGVNLSSIRPLAALTQWCPVVYHRAECYEPCKPNGAHSDESTAEGAHYSGILYLTSKHDDFEGGDFYWLDPPAENEEEKQVGDVAAGAQRGRPQRGGHRGGRGLLLAAEQQPGNRALTQVSPMAGMAMIFSSGWENIHYFDPITSGTRISMPAFFTTSPSSSPEDELIYDFISEVMTGEFDESAADRLWRCLLQPQTPLDFNDLHRKWHEILTSQPQ